MSKVLRLFLGSLFCLLACSTAWAAETPPLKLSASVAAGYDNNSFLNSARKEDAFSEETVNVRYRLPSTGIIHPQLEYHVLNADYFEATDQNVLWQEACANADIALDRSTVLETDYEFEYVYFPNDESVTSYDHKGRVGILRQVTKPLRFGAGFSAGHRHFEKNFIRQANRLLSPIDEREDKRYTIDTELSYTFWDNKVLKAGYVHFWNDSNYTFQDFYDEESDKFYLALGTQFFFKWFAIFKFSYERLDYESRPLENDDFTFEVDDLYTTTASFYYQINKAASVGINCSYRQKYSNEPVQEYSGFLTTLGFYYSF